MTNSGVKPIPHADLRVASRNRPTRPLLTASAVAALLALPKSTVYEAARQNRIGGVIRVGRIVRFDPVKLDAWLRDGGQALPGGWRQEEVA